MSVVSTTDALPDWDIKVPELGDLDIDLDEKGTHEAPHSPHANKDWQIPHIVEHARSVECQAVSVEAKVSVAPEVGCQYLPWVLLHALVSISETVTGPYVLYCAM